MGVRPRNRDQHAPPDAEAGMREHDAHQVGGINGPWTPNS
jgi:hypothetical protein